MKITRLFFLTLGLTFHFLAGSQVVTDTFYVAQDAFVNSGATSTNYGTNHNLNVFQDTGATVKVYRSYIQFDLSSIPENALITSATLRLVPDSINNTKDHPLYIEKVDTTSWSEGSITWSNQPPTYTSDRVSVTHAQTTGTTLHSFNVKDHVQYFVRYGYNNNGWRIRLQDESDTSDFGLMYFSSDTSTTSLQPSLEVKYIMPIEIKTYVTHCTPGNSDASVNVELSGGSASYDHYWWYTESSTGGTTVIEHSATVNSSTIDISSLSPGIYIFKVRDYAWVADNNDKYYFYQRVIIGREGEVTTLTICPTNTNAEDLPVYHQKIAGSDFDNTNYATSIYLTSTQTPTSASGSVYDTRALLKFNMDFDPRLEFDTARLYLQTYYGHFRNSTATNESYISRVTSPWEETVTTWNCRPTTTTTGQVYLPQTGSTGYTYESYNVYIEEMVQYWQQNPADNYGVELALLNYSQSYSSRLGFSTADQGSKRPSLILSFTVKPAIETVYYDSLDLGDITVNAPAAELPYTYLISYDTIPTMSAMWSYVKDSVDVDSVTFFRGKSNTRNYTFSDLPAEHYFVAVFDNRGTLIFDEEVYLTPPTTLLSSYHLDGDTLKVGSGYTSGYGTLDAAIAANESGSFEFKVSQLGDIILGLNYQSQSGATVAADFEYAVELNATTKHFKVETSGTVLFEDTLILNDIFRIEKENYEFVVYRNEFEMYRHQMTRVPMGDFKTDLVFKKATGILLKPVKVGKIKTPQPIKTTITQTECDQVNGSIKMAFNSTLFSGVTGGTYTIKNASSGSTVESGTFTYPNPITEYLPAGDYKVIYTTTGSPATSWTEYFTIGQPVLWDFQNAYYTPVGSTITTNSMINTAFAISQNILQSAVTEGFVTFKMGTKHNYVPWGGGTYIFPVSSSVSFVESDEDQVIKVRAFSFGPSIINKYIEVYNYSNTLVNTPFMIDTEGPFKIKLYNDTLKTYYNNSTTAFAYVAQGTPDDYRVQATSFCGYVKDPFVDFCYGSTTSEQCAELDYELNGNYYVTNNGYFCFVFNQEYNDSTITFNIYNRSNAVIATQADFALEDMIFGENRVVLDFTNNGLCLGKGYFVLEVINGKNEKFYLRFYNNYLGCIPVMGSTSPLMPFFE